ncbi:MAG: NADH:ubiquinone reductase (Na(+)-transporting) subunit B [Bacteroidales bacterium]|jgi:Na+-transporting NADH:ubiquinone oxidoreductase subunit B|nr:NADH:ubiquinone reductase (Na(+)-transporting) subunit B [Bacteroidales bacterium]
MRRLEKISEKIEKNFEKGKPLHPFYSLFDAADTFLLTPKDITKTGSHIRDAVDMKRAMMTVIVALLPTLLFGLWNIGYQHNYSIDGSTELHILSNFWYGFLVWLPIVITVYVSGLSVEIIFAQIRKHQVAEGFFVTGMLIPLIVPPGIPLWIVSLATIFAVIFGKEVFGGNGYNFLNPALLARAFIFFAYPSVISGNKVWIADKADAFSGATPLDICKNAADAGLNANELLQQLPSIFDSFIGIIPGSIGETSKLAILLGGIILVITGVASWRIMVSTMAGGYLTALLFNLFGSGAYAAVPAHQQILMGGLLFAAVFMATDPVSSTHTRQGEIIFGLLIGILTILVRQWNQGYVEGLVLGLFLMNVLAPLIDWCVIQLNINKRKRRAIKARV